MAHLEPTYLRYIYDGLIKGSIHPENSAELPDGLIGLYDEAFDERTSVVERQKLLQRFATWALFKKEVSVAFVAEVLNETEDEIQEFISTFSAWFNSPESGKYQLYHERLKVYLLQKLSEGEIHGLHEKLISRLERAIEEQKADEFEWYGLEFLGGHLALVAMLNGDGKKLIELAYSQTHWQRQLKISKGYSWTKNGLKEVMTWASKYNNDAVIECGLQMVDLHHLEQNTAPEIVALVAKGDLESALKRLEQFGGNDKEGLQRKFVLYMLCLMELTLLGRHENHLRKKHIIQIIKHLEINLPVDHSILNWNDFFSSYLMFQLAFELSQLGVDYLILFMYTFNFEKEWLKENGPYNELQFEVLIRGAHSLVDQVEYSGFIKYISMEFAKQGKITKSLEYARTIPHEADKIVAIIDISSKMVELGMKLEKKSLLNESLECAKNISDESKKSFALREISIEFAKQGGIKESLEIASNISSVEHKIFAFKEISTELDKLGKRTLANTVIQDALKLARGIIGNGFNKIDSLMYISSQLDLQGKRIEANIVMLEALECANRINLKGAKYSAIKGVCIELAKQGKIKDALKYSRGIIFDGERNNTLKDIATEMAKQGNMTEAIECTNIISSESTKCIALKEISSEIAKRGGGEAEIVLNDALKVARAVIDFNLKNNSKKAVAIEYYKQDNLDKCVFVLYETLEFERGISSFLHKCEALIQIANELAKNGKIESAIIVLENAINLSDSISPEYFKNLILKEISTKLANLGNKTGAIELARRLKMDYWKLITLKAISYELYEQGEVSEANNVMQEVLEIAKSNDSLRGKSKDLYLISTELAKQGRTSEALLVMQEALDYARCISVDWKKSDTLKGISIEFAKQGIFEKALECAQELSNLLDKINALKEISRELAKREMVEDASKVIHDALKCIEELSSTSEINYSLKIISIELSSQGLITEAIECTHKISEESDKSSALVNISMEIAKHGMIMKALECARGIRSKSGKSLALKNISIELAKSNNWLLSQKTCLEIPMIAEQHSCWKNISQRISDEFGWKKALLKVTYLQDKESQRYYLKGMIENIKNSECNKQMLLSTFPYYLNDFESLQILFLKSALHEIFFESADNEKLERLNRTLNIQWAIDIKNQIN